jgi:hypothetical protein
MTEREKPIVDIRAINYRWAEMNPDARPGALEAIAREAFRIEIRREGDVEWIEIPVVERASKPPG